MFKFSLFVFFFMERFNGVVGMGDSIGSKFFNELEGRILGMLLLVKSFCRLFKGCLLVNDWLYIKLLREFKVEDFEEEEGGEEFLFFFFLFKLRYLLLRILLLIFGLGVF